MFILDTFCRVISICITLIHTKRWKQKKIKPGFIWNDRWQIDTLEYATRNLVWLRRCKKIKQWYTITRQFTQRKSIQKISQIIFQKFRDSKIICGSLSINKHTCIYYHIRTIVNIKMLTADSVELGIKK